MSGPRLKAFVSYAHRDRLYFEQIIKELKAHTKHSLEVDWAEIWEDRKIPLGSDWDQFIRKILENCDFSILLVSQHFIASKYIRRVEFKSFIDRQKDKGILLFPVYLEPANIDQWKELKALQFFMPVGKKYGHPEIEKLSYADLIEFGPNAIPLPNPNRARYMKDLVGKIEAQLREWKLQNHLPATRIPHLDKKIFYSYNIEPIVINAFRNSVATQCWHSVHLQGGMKENLEEYLFKRMRNELKNMTGEEFEEWEPLRFNNYSFIDSKNKLHERFQSIRASGQVFHIQVVDAFHLHKNLLKDLHQYFEKEWLPQFCQWQDKHVLVFWLRKDLDLSTDCCCIEEPLIQIKDFCQHVYIKLTQLLDLPEYYKIHWENIIKETVQRDENRSPLMVLQEELTVN